MRDRDYAVDFLKAAAIIAVVLIHTSTAYLDRISLFSFSFDTILTVNSFARFAVPLFFLTSGLLLGAKYSTHPSPLPFYKKRILRILPPYLFWTIMYYLLFHSVWAIFRWNFVKNLITGDTSYQFYFIPTICVLYLLFPFFMRFKSFFLSKWGILLLLIFECIILYNVYYGPPLSHSLFSPVRVALLNVFPFVFGIYLSNRYEKSKRFLRHNFFLSGLLWVFTGAILTIESIVLFGTSLNSLYINNQWRPSVLFYALASGAFLYNLYEKHFTNKNKVILWLSTYSFGVFFIHVALMYPLLKVVDKYKLYGIVSFVVFFAITITASYILIYIASKIPKVGRIISAT